MHLDYSLVEKLYTWHRSIKISKKFVQVNLILIELTPIFQSHNGERGGGGGGGAGGVREVGEGRARSWVPQGPRWWEPAENN